MCGSDATPAHEPLRKPRLVLFDAVGTLLHPEPHVADAYLAAGKRWGSRYERADVERRFRDALARYAGRAVQPISGGCSGPRSTELRSTTSELRERQRWQRIVAHVFDDIPQHSRAVFEHLWQYFSEPQHWRLDESLAEVWSELAGRQYTLGVASNFDARLLTVCQGHPPLNASPHIYYSSQLGFVKPDRRFYQAIERRAGFGASEILLIGDDPLHDYIAPCAAGWQGLLLDPGQHSARAEYARIAGLADLLSLL